MKESKWFSTVVIVVLMGINGLSFMVMQWQKVSQNRLIAAMAILALLSLTYILIMGRSKLKSKRSRSDR